MRAFEDERLKALIEKIGSERCLKLTIAVDKNTKIIIDGHYRVCALK